MKRYHHCVILFRSIHDVSAGERALKEHDLWCDMVPAPRTLTSNCGMVLEFHGRDLDKVKGVVKDEGVRCAGIFTSGGGAYERE